MKRTLVSIILFLIVIASVIVGAVMKRNNDNSNLTKVKVAEVAHSIFYAPQYAAISNGYFEEEGLDIELILTPGADAVMSSVLSGDVNIGFSGTEATIYVYNGGEEDYPVTFAALTKRDGAFLVSREKIDNFTLNDLKGKSVIGGRTGGMPEMTFEWALRENGIDPKNDLTIDRKDNTKNYCPENCRWVTSKEQANNRTNNVVVNYNGMWLSVNEVASILGKSYGYVYQHYRNLGLIEHKKDVI